MTRALFIGGHLPEAAIAAAAGHDHMTVFCSSEQEIRQHWMFRRSGSIEPVVAVPELIDTTVQTRYANTFDTVYLADPGSTQRELARRFICPGGTIRMPSGGVLEVVPAQGISAAMTDPDDATPFLMAYGQFRFGPERWIGPLAAELEINSNTIVKMVKGKSRLRWDHPIITTIRDMVERDTAELAKIRAMAGQA